MSINTMGHSLHLPDGWSGDSCLRRILLGRGLHIPLSLLRSDCELGRQQFIVRQVYTEWRGIGCVPGINCYPRCSLATCRRARVLPPDQPPCLWWCDKRLIEDLCDTMPQELPCVVPECIYKTPMFEFDNASAKLQLHINMVRPAAPHPRAWQSWRWGRKALQTGDPKVRDGDWA